MFRSGLQTYLLFFFSMAAHWTEAQSHFNIIREEVYIPLADGTKLGCISYRPRTEEKLPALVYRTPYGIDDYDSYAELPRKAAQRGYVVFLVDVRGRYRSEGQFEAYRNEQVDGYNVIEWVARHPLCNGKVMTYGGSYPGIVQWQAMSLAPPSLVGAAPEMTPIGSHHFFYNGGAFSMTWLDWFMSYIIPDKRKRADDTSGPWKDTRALEQWRNSDRQAWYSFRPLDEMPLLREYAPEYFEWLRHPNQTEWWSFVDMEAGFDHFVVPVFLLSGWYDSVYGVEGAWRAFDLIHAGNSPDLVKNHSRLIIGPWNHTSIHTHKTRFGDFDFGASAGLDYDRLLLDWFDLLVREEPHSKTEAHLFVMGTNSWRSFDQWPVHPSSEMNLFLQQDYTLDTLQQTTYATVGFRFDPTHPVWDEHYEKSIPYDQSGIEGREDVLVYTSKPLVSDLEVIGEIKLRLAVSSTAKDTDFTFTLCDVYPDGRSVNLSGLDAGYLRMRYRNGYEEQELINPGKVYSIEVRGLYTANVFRKGHRIRIYITSSMAPHYDPNPNTGRAIASETGLAPALNTIHLGGKHLSKLILPVYSENKVPDGK